MIAHKRAETISLVTLLTVVLAAGLFIFFLNTASKFLYHEVDNSGLIFPLATKTQQILKNYPTTPSQSLEEYFVLGSNDLLLFFSKGDNDILLSHKFREGQGAELEDGIIPKEHYLKFERPAVPECTGSACICHCANGGNFWTSLDEEPYLKRTNLKIISNPDFQGYMCAKPTCQEIDSNEEVQFVNGRGIDTTVLDAAGSYSSYANEAYKQIKQANDKDQFYPIMMDIVLLIQNKAKNDGNFLFSTGAGDNYNSDVQQSEYVKMLLDEYSWQGGVVIGGTGFAKDGKDQDDHALRTVPLTLRLQSYPDAPGIIGVCNFETCLYEKGLASALSIKEQKEEEHEINPALVKEVSEFYVYLLLTAGKQINDDGSYDPVNFLKKVNSFFEGIPSSTLDARLVLAKHSEGIEVYGLAGDLQTEKKLAHIAYFIYPTGDEAISPLSISAVDVEKETITIRDLVYKLKYNQEKKTLELIQQ